MKKQLSNRIKRLGIVLLACMLLTLSACGTERTVQAETYYYTLFTQNGQWFMEFRAGRVYSDSIPGGSDLVAFTSPADLLEKLKNGDLPANYLRRCLSWSTIRNGILPIYDLNHLYDLSLPEGVHYTGIYWYGSLYYFKLKNGDNSAYIYCVPKEQYQKQFRWYFDGFLTARPEQILSDTTDNLGVRDIYTHQQHFLDHYRLYSIQAPSQTLYIHEHKKVVDHSGKLQGEDAIRYVDASDASVDVTILGSNGNYYFYGTLNGLQERPDEEWLSAFALVPYEWE